jgi:hypothetical protein
MVQCPGHGDHSAIAHASVGGFESDNAAVGRRNANRSSGIRSERGNTQIGGDGCG